MGAFEGFLTGFTRTGSKIVERNDAARERKDELAFKSSEEFNNSNRLNELEAARQQKNKLELLAAEAEREKEKNAAMFGGTYIPKGVNNVLPSSPLQIGDEASIEDPTQEISSTTASTAPAAVASSGLVPSAFGNVTPAELETGKRIAIGVDNKAAATYLAKAAADNEKRAYDTNKEERKETETQRKENRKEWEDINTNKNNPRYPQMKAAASALPLLLEIKKTREASKKMGVQSGARAFALGLNPATTSDEAKQLEYMNSKSVQEIIGLWSGAVSNYEASYFQSLGVSPNQKDSVNQARLDIMELGAARAFQFQQFATEAKNKGISATDAIAQWDNYLKDQDENNPAFDMKTKTLQRDSENIMKDTSWKSFLGGKETSPTSSSKSVKPSASSVPNAFDDAFNALTKK